MFGDVMGPRGVMYSVARSRGDRREEGSVGVIHVMRGFVIGVVMVVVVELSSCRVPAVDSSDV